MCLAIPGELLRITNDDPLTRSGFVKFGGVTKEVNLAYVPEVKIGDYVIVHVGCAISILNAEQAQQIFTDLEAMAQAQESEEASDEISG
ncbi:HypC/HybG/HupF family hydrogenase formation chaperone [Alkalinema sp. FACHB-956]|uniref:HypC/HybG/HupF family hydrogenase formation chaperone n=1 Tax=Alkalinema sp. FACHB-956 TaxID=2692768 RepID=UPI0016868330|nr:HypC/HybG/HupF family hydrogenase formation chaperone [Alkalinema sp. FACHB-956]MBD2328658.1 HypC/HybG/HupF family hydrogenase formation chaperone [Alkalinema sp. FACHB-956]